jgi:hypothetical protein
MTRVDSSTRQLYLILTAFSSSHSTLHAQCFLTADTGEGVSFSPAADLKLLVQDQFPELN